MYRKPGTLKLILVMAATGLVLSACAGGFSEDTSMTKITTEPAVAQCKLEGRNFVATVQTPASVVLPKKASPVAMTCGAKGHHAFSTTLRPRFNTKVFNNLLIGSLTGIIIDMANGHGSKYPEKIHVHMEPSAFATVEARDGWFGRYRNYVEQKWRRAEAELIDSCKTDENATECDTGIKALASNRANELEILERRRRQAHIDASMTAQRPAATPAPAQ